MIIALSRCGSGELLFVTIVIVLGVKRMTVDDHTQIDKTQTHGDFFLEHSTVSSDKTTITISRAAYSAVKVGLRWI